MICALKGVLESVSQDKIEINVNGIFYEIICTKSALSYANIGEEIKIETIQIFKEDSQTLYGFSSKEEKNWFTELTKINGVGAKFAISILSSLTINELYFSILSCDEKALTRANGIGAKLASRIVNEMQNAIKKIPAPNQQFLTLENKENVATKQLKKQINENSLNEALETLVALGFSKGNCYQIALEGVKSDEKISTQDLVKFVLSKISKPI